MAKLSMQTFVSAAVGAASAILVIVIFSGDHEPAQASAGSQSPGKLTVQQDPVTGAMEREVVVRYDEGRIARLEDELARMKEAGGRTADDAPKDQPPPTAEEERRFLQAQFDEIEQQFGNDAIDPGWAPQATMNLQDRLLALSDVGGFAVDAVECKSTFCKARLSWDSYGSARGAPNFAEQRIPGLNCAKSYWLPEPRDVSAPYSADVYLDCSELRAGLVEPVPFVEGEGE